MSTRKPGLPFPQVSIARHTEFFTCFAFLPTALCSLGCCAFQKFFSLRSAEEYHDRSNLVGVRQSATPRWSCAGCVKCKPQLEPRSSMCLCCKRPLRCSTSVPLLAFTSLQCSQKQTRSCSTLWRTQLESTFSGSPLTSSGQRPAWTH
eukprot:2759482-Amphidinium_carterae.1